LGTKRTRTISKSPSMRIARGREGIRYGVHADWRGVAIPIAPVDLRKTIASAAKRSPVGTETRDPLVANAIARHDPLAQAKAITAAKAPGPVRLRGALVTR
jgi:hypothetical protein